MTERPIIFSGAMVRAILAGQKTQTRRVVKTDVPFETGTKFWRRRLAEWVVERWPVQDRMMQNFGRCENIKCPYGRVGDRLWVRESWALLNFPTDHIAYRADGDLKVIKWSPSIHMRREYSRINLEVTGVRVERLQNISETGARAEGITDGGCLNCGNSEADCGCLNPKPDARDAFSNLWQSINGAGSWAANPWVWVVEFKRL